MATSPPAGAARARAASELGPSLAALARAAPAGAVALTDAESGAELHLELDEETAGRYRQALSFRLEQLRAVAAARGATYALVPADWPLEQAVLPFLQRRALVA